MRRTSRSSSICPQRCHARLRCRTEFGRASSKRHFTALSVLLLLLLLLPYFAVIPTYGVHHAITLSLSHTMQAKQLSLLFQLLAQYSPLIVPSFHLSLSSLPPYHQFTEASFFTIRFSCLPFVEGLSVGRLCIGMCFLTMKLKCREISRLDMRARAGVALLGSGFLMLDGTHVHHFFQD